MRTMSCDEVAPGIWVGSYPQSPEDIHHLAKDLGVTGLVCLQDDYDMGSLGLNWDILTRAYASVGIDARREPVRDFSPDDLLRTLPRCVAAIHDLRSQGKTVYVHCTVGLNRSPTAVIAYLHAHEGLSVDEARERVQSRRQCYPYEEVLLVMESVLAAK